MKRLLDLLSYPRSYLVTVLVALHTGLMSALVMIAVVLFRSKRLNSFLIQKVWAGFNLWVSGVEVDFRGREILPSGDKGFLILFNHTSLADILILYGSFPKMFNFGAKIELFKIPLFGWALAACGTLKVDRADRKGAMQVYQEAIARVKRGDVFALAPEGTRQTEPTLGRFKRGPFEFAVNAQMNLVPVIIAGALQMLPKDTIWLSAGKWKHKVIVQVLPSISTEGLTAAHLEELQNKVRASMEAAYSNLNRELGIEAPVQV